jgi:hypothetical protein
MDLGTYPVTHSNQTPNTVTIIAGVRLWGISFMVEREKAQTAG